MKTQPAHDRRRPPKVRPTLCLPKVALRLYVVIKELINDGVTAETNHPQPDDPSPVQMSQSKHPEGTG